MNVWAKKYLYAAFLSLAPTSYSEATKYNWVPDSSTSEYRKMTADATAAKNYLSGYLSSSSSPANSMRAQLDPASVAHMAQVWRYNAFPHPSTTDALHLFNSSSFLNHACDASAVWQFGKDNSLCLLELLYRRMRRYVSHILRSTIW